MEVVLTRLRDFSCKDSTFDGCESAGQSACRGPPRRAERLSEGCKAAEGGRNLDIESALAWLRKELVGVMLEFDFSFFLCTFQTKFMIVCFL